ncbi:MAG: UDP-2,3-diacylglucosamine diphosphatase [bacterium]
MYCIFLSDAHLKGRTDKNQDRIVNFLKAVKKEHPDIIFFLGDIFDYWISPGGFVDPVYIPLLNIMRELDEQNIKMYYNVGNHDFMVKRTFESLFKNLNIVGDSIDITLDNTRCFITHGDMIDYTDKRYRLLRSILRSRVMNVMADILPVSITKRIALSLSRHSRESWTVKRTMPDYVIKEFVKNKAEQGFDVVVSAHFHVPEMRKYLFSNKEVLYINTGNWFNAYSYLLFKDSRFDLKYYNGSL